MIWWTLSLAAFAGIRPDAVPGLVGGPARAVCAPDGRVWVATDEGLNRIDGDRRQIFGASDGLPDSAATAVTIDSDGDVWVGTERGLGWVDGDRVVTVEGVPGPIYAFGTGPDGRTVVGVQGVSYAAIVDITDDGPSLTELTLPHGLHVRDAAVLASGAFLVGTNDGLYRVDGTSLVLVPGTDGTKAGPFVPDGDALFFATGDGVVRYDGRSLRRWLPGHYITGLVRGPGGLHAGTGDGELYRIRTLDATQPAERLGQGPPQSLFSLVTTSGLVFGATWGGGLVRYDPEDGAFDVFGADQGLASGVVRRLDVDRDGALWITTAAGVQVLADFATDVLGAAEIGSDDVSALAQVGGQLVVGTGRGVAVHTAAGWETFDRRDGLTATSVTDVSAVDGMGALLTGPAHGEGVSWLRLDPLRVEGVEAPWGRPDPRWGHNAGPLARGGWLVERHSGGEVVEVDTDGLVTRTVDLPDGAFVQSIRSGAGQTWLATTAGVKRWDTGLVDVPWPVRDLDVDGVVPAADGVWVRYARPIGVDRFVGDARTSWTRDDGLPSDRVLWVHPVEDGAWVGTSAGVARIRDDRVVRVLTRRDGLPTETTTDGLVDDRGVLWLATAEGLVRQTPWRERAAPDAVDLQVDATLAGRPLDGATTGWGQRDLVAHLDVRTAIDRDALRFRWRLLPGGGWTPWTSERTIRSTGLDAGTQRLEVETRDGSGRVGRWSAAFAVHPPWWRWPPFVGLAFASPFAGLVVFGWLRLRRIRFERDRLEHEVLLRTAELRVLAGDLAAQSEAKSRYLADMSHELRTPLNAIIGYTEMLAEEARDEGLSDLLPDMARVEVAAHHLLSLINDVLDLARIEAGRIELKMQTVDLASLAAEVTTTLQPIAMGNGNTLTCDVPADSLVRADPQRIRQILTNLVGNACKFTRDGTIALRLEREGKRVSLAVHDTGIGMTATELSRLFQPFNQANEQTQAEFGGTGLGLAISRELARAMGGELHATSERGVGSVFRLTLPRVL
jgi:signal transduction histidine kinase